MPRLAAFILVTISIFLASSCATGARMWRISPLSSDAAPDRVNLWPLAYHNGDQTSVLWPLFDVDDLGFALRPIVAKEGPNWSILYPYAAFDTDRGQGWIFPFYRFEENAGLFPVANFGRWSYVGPVWWKSDAGMVKSGGLFPVAGFGDLNYVGPVWWFSEGGKYGDAGLFPVTMFGALNYIGPLWWSRGWSSYGVFPIFGKDLFGTEVHHVGPAWWESRGEDGFSAGVFPLLSFASDGTEFSLLPLYSHELRPESRTRNILLGLGHSHRSNHLRERWLAPLYYHRQAPGKRDTALFPFFWKRTRGDRSDVYTLLGHRRVDPESSSLNLYPLWWSNTSADSSWRMLLPLFYYAEEGDERTLITPLGGRGWSRSGESAFVNFLGPLFHRSVSKRRDETRTAFLWPLFERVRKGDETTTRMVPFFSATSSPDAAEAWYALGLGQRQRDATGSSHRLWPLYSWSDQEEHPGLLYDLTLFGHRRQGGTTKRRLFPLYSSRTSDDETLVDAALGLVHFRDDSSGTEREREWWLWPLISHRTGSAQASILSATTLAGGATWDGGRSFHLGASLLYSSVEEEVGDTTRRSRRILGLYTHDRRERSAAFVPSGLRTHDANLSDRNAYRLLFGAFLSDRSTFRAWRGDFVTEREASALSTFAARQEAGTATERHVESARSALAAHDVEPADTSRATLLRAVEDLAADGTELVEHRKIRIPLVYGYERVGDEVSWSGPLWLLRSKKRPGHGKFSALYYAYRRETKGGRTTRDIFPFITWDTGPDETSFSFLWRLVHYERRGGRRGGHFLFIPWGDREARHRR